MERVHQQCSDTSIEGNSDSTVNRILQQGRTQVHTLRTPVHGKPGQNHHRNGIGHIAPNSTRRHLVRDSTGCHCIVTTDAIVLIGYDKRATTARQLVGQRPSPKPLVKHGFAALEFVQTMCGR